MADGATDIATPTLASAPKQALPPGAWDSHAHVFGPFDRYPLLERRRYHPPLGAASDYLAMLDAVGFGHGVLVHASAYGYDNRCTADALAAARMRLTGVCVVDPQIKDADLEQLHAEGFRAIRFTATGPRAMEYPGSIHMKALEALAPRIKALGWHAQVWGSCQEIVDARAQLTEYDFPVVFDHMGYFDIEAGVGGAVFQEFLALLSHANLWAKACPIRLGRAGPDYREVRPFHDALIRAIPDRLVFGTDWPFISLDKRFPDPGQLVDLFDAWTGDAALRQAVFVDNPARLYGGGLGQ
jgi:2-pyrone-4,6-dicarboxylate lactonase